jgi:hypothetical protein
MIQKICESCIEFGTSLEGKPKCKKNLKLWKTRKCKGHDMLGEDVRSILTKICIKYHPNYDFESLVENMEDRMESLNIKYPSGVPL